MSVLQEVKLSDFKAWNPLLSNICFLDPSRPQNKAYIVLTLESKQSTSQLANLKIEESITSLILSSLSSALAAELLNVLPADWLEAILDQVKSEEERESIIWLCSQFKYYRLCVRLLAQANQTRRLLSWITDRDDVRLLQSKIRHCYPEAYLPRDITEWAFLLTCMREKQLGKGSGQEKSDTEMASEPLSTEVETEENLKEGVPKSSSDFERNLMDKNELDTRTVLKEVTIPEEGSEERTEGKFNDSGLTNSNPDVNPASSARNAAVLSVADERKAGSKGNDGDKNPNSNPTFSCQASDSSTVKCNALEQDLKKADSPWSLTWGNVGYLLLEHLGGAAAINLLVSHMTREGDDPSRAWSGLGSEFVRACYTSFLLEGQKDQVSHEMLERMSVFMWSKKPGFLAPSVHHAFKAEQNLVEKKQGRETDVQRVFGQVKSLSNQSLQSEYLGGHWGV
ncbi:hypothetical protein EGW08_012535, partial [Elysia chlorotica]